MTSAIITALKVFTLALVASIVCIGSPAQAQSEQSFLEWHQSKVREAQSTIEALQRDQERFLGNPRSRSYPNYNEQVHGFATRLARAHQDLASHMADVVKYQKLVGGHGYGRLRALAPVALAAGVAGAGTITPSEAMASDVRVSSVDGAPKPVRLSGSNVGNQSELIDEVATTPTRSTARSARISR